MGDFSGWSHQQMADELKTVAPRKAQFSDLQKTYADGAARFDSFHASLESAINLIQGSWSSEEVVFHTSSVSRPPGAFAQSSASP